MTLKIVVMGSGGVGGYFGGRLAHSGSKVTFVARGAHLAAIRQSGLRIESSTGDAVIAPATVTMDPADAEDTDIVIFAVKMADTEQAAASIKPLVQRGARVFTFQNGVASADRVGRIVGHENVVSGTAQIAAVIKEPGVIKHTGTMQRLVFGEIDGAPSSRTQRFLEACKAAGINAELSGDIARTVWQKFVFLAPFAGLTTLTRGTIGPIRSEQRSRQLLERAIREAVLVGAAHGINIGEADIPERLTIIDNLPSEMTSSMCHDLLAGKPLEVNGLSGEVVRLGEVHGIPTPVHSFIADLLSVFEKGAGKA